MKQTGLETTMMSSWMRMELRTLHRACVVYAKLHNPSYRIQVREGEATG